MIIKNVRLRILLATIMIALAGVIIFVNLSFRYYQNNAQNVASKLVNSNLLQAGNQIENIYMDLMKLARVVAEDETVSTSLQESSPDVFPLNFKAKTFAEFSMRDYYRYSRTYERLRYYQNNFLFNYDSHISLLMADGIICNLTNSGSQENDATINEYLQNLQSQEWYQDFYKSKDMLTWIVPFTYSNLPGEDTAYLTMAYKLYNGNDKFSAVLLIHVNMDALNIIFQEDFPADIYLFSEDDKLIYSRAAEEMNSMEEDMEYTEFLDEIPDNYLIYPYHFNHFGLKMVALMSSYDGLLFEMSAFQQTYIVLSLVIFGFMILSIFLVTDYLTRPLKKLVRRLKSGEFDIFRIEQNVKTDEITSIADTFENMFKHIDLLHRQLMDEQEAKYQLKYDTLRAQINPHFLFNTLNIIKWRAIVDGNKEISQMLADLGSLLESSMGRTSEYITLREEISLLRSYMNIQNMRFSKEYLLEVDCPESLYEYKILKLILQPVVENSIVHGFQGITGEAAIFVEINKEGDSIYIVVSDNGIGMSEQRAKEILASSDKSESKSFNGIGLSNINQRIKLQYGNEYGITIASDRLGTKICFHIPARL